MSDLFESFTVQTLDNPSTGEMRIVFELHGGLYDSLVIMFANIDTEKLDHDGSLCADVTYRAKNPIQDETQVSAVASAVMNMFLEECVRGYNV